MRASQRLWLTRIPTWTETAWNRLKGQLLNLDQNWEVWTEWYEDRLHGQPANESLELARAIIPDEIWHRGPAAVNARIRELIADHARFRSVDPPQIFNFSLSYASE